jgi:hypothetical protein
MIDTCQQEKSYPPSFAFLICGKYNSYMIQIINRGGIIETTVDHSDIRGLGTACHGFVVELPLS